MNLIFLIIILSLTFILVITLLNAITAPSLRKKIACKDIPLVSVLIPVRNEKRNIQRCLEDLLSQDYPLYEIIVLDDHSDDGSGELVKKIAADIPHLRLFMGKKIPHGWIGKNWACHQLSVLARGEILIFTDADNRYAEDAVSRTVAWIQEYRCDLFSAFPQQCTKTMFEKLIVPTVYMTVYCYLPLWLTYYSRFSSLAAANGQWIAFTKNAYRSIGGHERVKGRIVEDIELARLVKKNKMRIITAAGTCSVYARMYHNRKEVWDGFSKNLFGLMS